MFEKIQNIYNSKKTRQLVDIRNIGLYIFGIVIVAIAWSGAKTLQSNYELQKKIATLQQENAVLHLQNENTYLQTKYYETDQYLELSARQNLGLAAPGEHIMLVPKETALKYIDQKLSIAEDTAILAAADNRPKYAKNLESWRDFLLGRKLFGD